MRPPIRKAVSQIVSEQVERDPGFAAVYEETRAEGHLARQLATFRERRGLSQRDLAKVTGISQPMINRLERAGENPTLATLQKITAALGAVIEISGGEILVREIQTSTPAVEMATRVLAMPTPVRSIPRMDTHQVIKIAQIAASRANEIPHPVPSLTKKGYLRYGPLSQPQAPNSQPLSLHGTMAFGENGAVGTYMQAGVQGLGLSGARAPELVT